MTENKHSPGPWHCNKFNPKYPWSGRYIYSNKISRKLKTRSEFTKLADISFPEYPPNPYEAYSNLKLMTLSPVMFDFLKKLKEAQILNSSSLNDELINILNEINNVPCVLNFEEFR